MSIGERIKQARKEADMTQQQLADYFGINRVSVTQWEGNTTKPDSLRLAALHKLFNRPMEWFLQGELGIAHTVSFAPTSTPEGLPNGSLLPDLPGAPVAVPVYGQAVGGNDGEFEFNGNILFEAMAPPVLTGIKSAYAVSIAGSSMSPRYEDGEVVFVDPKRRPRKGDYVIAQIQNKEGAPALAFVKKFLSHTQDKLLLEQFQPTKKLEFGHDTVISVHVIVAANSLG